MLIDAAVDVGDWLEMAVGTPSLTMRMREVNDDQAESENCYEEAGCTLRPRRFHPGTGAR